MSGILRGVCTLASTVSRHRNNCINSLKSSWSAWYGRSLATGLWLVKAHWAICIESKCSFCFNRFQPTCRLELIVELPTRLNRIRSKSGVRLQVPSGSKNRFMTCIRSGAGESFLKVLGAHYRLQIPPWHLDIFSKYAKQLLQPIGDDCARWNLVSEAEDLVAHRFFFCLWTLESGAIVVSSFFTRTRRIWIATLHPVTASIRPIARLNHSILLLLTWWYYTSSSRDFNIFVWWEDIHHGFVPFFYIASFRALCSLNSTPMYVRQMISKEHMPLRFRW